MFCTNCGNEVKDGEKFCAQCGHEVSTKVSQDTNINQEKLKGMEDNKSINSRKKGISPGLIVLLIFVFLLIIGMTVSSSSKYRENTNIDTYTTSKLPTKKYINQNETISGKDWEINVVDTYFNQRIDPPDKSGLYTYYQVKDTNNTYLCIILNAKNISSLELRASKVATIKVKYNNNYSYSSFSAISSKNLGFTYTDITNIKPLTSDSIYYLAEMPLQATNNADEPIEIEIHFENETYYYKYR